MPYIFRRLKIFYCHVLHRDHNVPRILIPLKVSVVGTDSREGKKALHQHKSQKGQSQGKGGGAKRLFLRFQCGACQFALHSKQRGQKAGTLFPV